MKTKLHDCKKMHEDNFARVTFLHESKIKTDKNKKKTEKKT